MSAPAGADVRVLTGFVIQQHHLLSNLTAHGNREVALNGADVDSRERRERALRLLLADEPTGAVDSVTWRRVLDLMAEVRETHGMTVIIVSDDAQVGTRSDRLVSDIDGVLNGNDMEPSMSPTPRRTESIRSPADVDRCR